MTFESPRTQSQASLTCETGALIGLGLVELPVEMKGNVTLGVAMGFSFSVTQLSLFTLHGALSPVCP